MMRSTASHAPPTYTRIRIPYRGVKAGRPPKDVIRMRALYSNVPVPSRALPCTGLAGSQAERNENGTERKKDGTERNGTETVQERRSAKTLAPYIERSFDDRRM